MEVTEFLELSKKLRLTETAEGGQRMQGPAKQIAQFLSASGQGEIENLFLGAYVTMMAAGLDRVAFTWTGPDALSDEIMDNTVVKVVMGENGMTLEIVREPEAAESSPGQPATETLSDGGSHD